MVGPNRGSTYALWTPVQELLLRNECQACIAFCEPLTFIIRGSLCCVCLSVGAIGALEKPPLLSWIFKLLETPGLQSLPLGFRSTGRA